MAAERPSETAAHDREQGHEPGGFLRRYIFSTDHKVIAANFMHLRFERASLVVTVVVGLLVTGAILYILIAPEAARIHQMLEAER